MAPRPDRALAQGDLPLYEEVRLGLTELISAGRWRPGEAIPADDDS